MRRILFIINPIAGAKKLRIDERMIRNYFEQTEIEVICIYSEYAGHAAHIASDHIGRVSDMIAIGGDGSLNEIGAQLVGTSVNLGLIPTGSGNGLARHVGIPVHSKRALEIIKEGYTQKVDVGRMNKHYFFSNAGIGIDSAIIKRYNEIPQRGWFTYGRLGLIEYFRFKPIHLELSWGEGFEPFEAALVSVALSNQYGYNFKIAPDASIADGLFVAQAIPMLHPLQSIGFAAKMALGQYTQTKGSIIRRCTQLDIKLNSPQIAQYDGEPVKVEGQITFEILPDAMSLIIPKHRIGNI